MVIILVATAGAFAQKVANYSVGKYGEEGYEHFSFWSKSGKRAEIKYSYGKDSKELSASYAGKGSYKGQKCFKVTLPGNYMLYVIPTGLKLRIVGPAKNFDKAFEWEYEGPVNGVGTFCNVCAQDEKEAKAVIDRYFMR